MSCLYQSTMTRPQERCLIVPMRSRSGTIRQRSWGRVMVDWYKHDIPDWMDATEDLDAECYRAFHVIVQLIMVNEKPIRNNERGISGRCRQSLRTYRRVIKELVEK